MMKIIIGWVLLLFISSNLSAKSNVQSNRISNPDSSRLNNWFLTTGYMQMKSTHGSYFRGGDLMLGYRYTSYISFGFGIKYAYTYYHFDNEWFLHHLNFLPVFVNINVNFLKNRMITPYYHLSTGITFVKYTKENKNTMGHPYTVREDGIYFNTGFGLMVKLGKHFAPIIEAGFQGFHMSTDQLAVNPHGVNVKIGVEW
jgi:hypothetical protein